MKQYENHCVQCSSGMGCMGNACPNKNVAVYYCDCCGEEIVGTIKESEKYEHLCEKCYSDLYENKQGE